MSSHSSSGSPNTIRPTPQSLSLMQQHANARRRSEEKIGISPEAPRKHSTSSSANGGPALRRGSGKNGVNNRTIGRERGNSDGAMEQAQNVIGMRVGKVEKSLDEAFRIMDERRRTAMQEKEELLSQILKIKGQNDNFKSSLQAKEYDRIDAKKVETYLRALEEQIMVLSRQLERAKRDSFKLSVVTGEKVTAARKLVASLRVVFFLLLGCVVVFVPEFGLKGGWGLGGGGEEGGLKLPLRGANDTAMEHVMAMQDYVWDNINWRDCMDRYGVFSITCILLHIVFETGGQQAKRGGKSWLKSMIDEGVVLWSLSVVVRSLVGVAEALATVIVITATGMALRADWRKATDDDIVEEEGDGDNTRSRAAREKALKVKALSSPDPSPEMSPAPSPAPDVPFPIKRKDSEHLFDHVYEEVQVREKIRAKAHSEPGTPPTLPKDTSSDLSALNDSVPVVNKDTGETMDLQFLEELNSQCHVFASDASTRGGIRSSSEGPPNFFTPPGRTTSSKDQEFMVDSNHKEFWSDLRQDRKKKVGMLTKLNGVRKKIHIPKGVGVPKFGGKSGK
ncbi:hypothetical protein TrST_g3185 [Triparma strigata]|uniref:Uncharacterized protein n=1 Tax=Triparma strigata TaxID=1606541 RepID=A0A9W7AGF1_9STRA|nr:hypothetical protein TrST_g3185 [Triparma strigata]